MMVSATLLTILALETAPTSKALTGITTAAERIPLPNAQVKVEVDGIHKHIYLKSPARKLLEESVKSSRLCPTHFLVGDGVVLECTQRRLYAKVEIEKGHAYLDLRFTRGIPPKGAFDVIPIHYVSPDLWDLGEICPGASAAAQAECLLISGKRADAEKLFREPSSELLELSLSYLRLGQAAESRMELSQALELYRKVPAPGKVLRFTQAHVCEISGHCFNEPSGLNTFDGSGLPEPLSTEMELRNMRVLAYLGQDEALLNQLRVRLNSKKRPPLCAETLPLCHTLLASCLKSTDERVRVEALELWVSGAMPMKGGRHLVVASAAAQVALELGAPSFAAHVLASAAKDVPRVDLADYLLRIVELYFQAQDTIRADVIFEFAKTKLTPKEWSDFSRRVAELDLQRKPGPAVEAIDLPEVDLAKELAQAVLLRSQLRNRPTVKETP